MRNAWGNRNLSSQKLGVPSSFQIIGPTYYFKNCSMSMNIYVFIISKERDLYGLIFYFFLVNMIFLQK